jgi:hypothetical protein
MTNLIFSADENLVDQAHAYAVAHGTTLDQLLQDYLRQIAAHTNRSAAADEFARLARLHPVQSAPGWRFDREDIQRRGDAP